MYDHCTVRELINLQSVNTDKALVTSSYPQDLKETHQ